MAFQSIKKGLPDSCRCMESSLLDGLVDNIVSGSPPPLPRGYLRYVAKTTSKLFPKAWDTAYEGYCRRFSPSLKATLTSGRANGGCLADLRNTQEIDHSDYLETVLFGRPDSHPLGPLFGALQVVQSAGKPRPLTTFDSDGHYLKPLHKTIYGYMSKKKWLCRGDVDRAKLRAAGFCRSRGLLVSGDYKSATDNLSIEVFETILRVILKKSAIVPPNIREFALRACRPFLFESKEDFGAFRFHMALMELDWREEAVKAETHGGQVFRPSKGQMMGSYLSFPFLCLQNYLAFRYCFDSRGSKIPPVIVNGDDILFQSTREEADTWLGTVGSLGLEVELTKTSVDADYGSLNSTLLRWGPDDYLFVVPTLRFGMLRPSEHLGNLGKSFDDFTRGEPGECKYRAGRVFFDFHLGEMKKSAWSATSLGFRGDLAHSLCKKYGLLSVDRLEGEYPPAWQPHDVVLPNALVAEVEKTELPDEVVEVSACEVASWKWSVGYRHADKVVEACEYAIACTRWTDDSSVVRLLSALYVPCLDGGVSAFDAERTVLIPSSVCRCRIHSPDLNPVSWLPGNREMWTKVRRGPCLERPPQPDSSWRFDRLGGRVLVQVESELWFRKPFMIDRPVRTTTRLHTSVFMECIERTDWFSGPLPTYEQSQAEAGVWRVEEAGGS